MPHPISATYLDVQLARVSAALPAAGAWDATPIEMVCPGFDEVTLSFTYTRGGQGNGAFDFQIETSPYSVVGNVPAGASEWVTEALVAAGAVVAGADTQSRTQREYTTYASQGADAEDFSYGPMKIGATIERMRVRARESGETGNPGTLQIQAYYSSKE